MRSRRLAFLLLACFWLAGCPSYSLCPLNTEADAVTEPALEGTWVSAEAQEKGEITFCKSKNGGYEFSVFDADTKIRQTYDAELVRLAGQLFMDVEFAAETLNGVSVDPPMAMLPVHQIMKVTISGDDLAFAGLEDDAIQKPNESGGSPLKYQLVNRGLFQQVLITAGTEDLRRYVAAHADEGFTDFAHLKRVGKSGN
jgi:hypothetical protein